MPQLLRIDSSADLHASTSRQLTALFADTWKSISNDHTVLARDLHRFPLPHLPSSSLHYAPHLRTAQEQPSEHDQHLQNELIAELTRADAVVLAAPMYHWSVPSTLKAWIDWIHVAGITAPFDSEERPLAGKPVVVISTRGVEYGPGAGNFGADHTVPPVQLALADSLGMHLSVVTVDLTLAHRIPALSGSTGKAADNVAAARQSVQDLAVSIGS
ncbi:FMN-dependent NADH-azoreductase [Rhodococcus sp. NPDC057014]|uniref:FMN-dependent NADH-azoreductase n=1 Tax=Rhodococcus sp. NPDC057014 TaxID=3346000 RepID=UPI00363CC3E1